MVGRSSRRASGGEEVGGGEVVDGSAYEWSTMVKKWSRRAG
jgi:hypothetical protein